MNLLKIIISFFCAFILITCSPQQKSQPLAINGVLDLQNWDFEKDGIVKLDGYWEFYWEKYCKTKEYIPISLEEEGLIDCSNNDLNGYIPVPNPWSSFKIGEKSIGSDGFGTYRLKILLPKVDEYAIKTENISSYKALLIKDKKYLTDKPIILSKEGLITNPKRDIISFSEADVELNIIVSNYVFMNAGILKSITLGQKKEIYSIFYQKVLSDLLLMGALLILGIYHLGLFLQRKEEKSSLYFSILSFMLCLRVSFTGNDLFYYLFPDLSWEIGTKLGYIFYSFSFFIFLNYLNSLNKSNKRRFGYYLKIYFIILTLLFIFIKVSLGNRLLDYSLYFSPIVFIYIIYEIIKLDKNIRKIFIIFFIILGIAVGIDVINQLFTLKFINFSEYGFLIFFIAQAYLLSSISSRTYRENENLTKILESKVKELNETKDRATEAYLDLEASQKRLVQSDKMITLGTMVAGIVHEINTPLSAIKSNSEMINYNLNNLLTKLEPSYSNLTLEDLQIIFNIIKLTADDTKTLSTKEMRQHRKYISTVLQNNSISNIEENTDYILELGLDAELEKNLEIFKNDKISYYLTIASEMISIRKKSKVITKSTDRVSKIVKSLKSFMHFEQGEEMILADIMEGMETVLIILHSKIKYGIEVIKNYSNIPSIYCYPDELNQIWTNLIHNSIQAMEETGKLIIDFEIIKDIKNSLDIDKRDLQYKGKYISVSIEDSGKGIPPEIRSKIFEAFFTTKPAGEGSGLGLHIIGKILEKHRGGLLLESEPGKTKFTVYLPMLENLN
jgi:signal transduction histidine kinase